MNLTVSDVLSENGQISKVLKGYEHRPQQLEAAEAVERCILEGRHIIIEAPTGSGKSLLYLTPSILWSIEHGKKTIVSTYTKMLQRQLIDKDLPLLQKAIGGFNYAICLGAENYLCLRRLQHALGYGLFESKDDSSAIEKLQRWQNRKPAGTYFDLDFSVSEKIWKRVCKDRYSQCEVCPYAPACSFTAAVKQQAVSEILVANHHITFSNIKAGSKALDQVGVVIFDEAHEAENVATDVFSLTLSSSSLSILLDDLHNNRKKGGLIDKTDVKDKQSAKAIIERIKGEVPAMHGLFQQGTSFIDEKDAEPLSRLSGLLDGLLAGIKETTSEIMKGYTYRLGEMSKCLNAVCSQSKAFEHVYWKTANPKGFWQVNATPVSVSGLLKKLLFYRGPKENPKVVVSVSATIATNGGMEFYRGRLGINDAAHEMMVDSPFDYRKQAVIYIPKGMPDPLSSSYKHEVVRKTEELINIFKGRTLMLFTNLKVMDETCDELRDRLPGFVFLKQGDSPPNKLVSDFKKTDKSVLLGAYTMWQGLDIPGDDLKCVIVTKLPFMVPSDPINIARQKYLEEKGINPFLFYQVPKAIILFKQGFGRLIRTKADRGLVAIMDSRVISKKYGELFLKALPNCQVIHSLKGVRLKDPGVQDSTSPVIQGGV